MPTDAAVPSGAPRYASLADLRFDRRSPRLSELPSTLSEDEVLERLWRESALERLVASIAANGFLPTEPLIVESAGSARLRLHHQRDAKLDVVVWRPFPDGRADGRAGPVVGFGQCATGRGWAAKLHELQRRAFAALWLREPLAV